MSSFAAPRTNAAVLAAVAAGHLRPATSLTSQPYGYFYDLDAFHANMSALRAAFPPNWHHAMAVKTSPLKGLLNLARAAGHGAECASIGEVIHSLQLGFKGEDVVFDSPCKTVHEIRYALENKVMLNIDNMQELSRVTSIWSTLTPSQRDGCVIGLRINPLVGFGAVANLSVSTRKSKFGIICPTEPCSERAEVVKALVECHFVNAVHVHTGSGGMTLKQMARGATAAVNLAMEVNGLRTEGKGKIDVIDIGGGLPVKWGGEQDPTFQEYSDVLHVEAPSLFDGVTFRRVVTEMGAMMNCRFAFYASVCEVTKPTDGGTIAMVHNGSDQFMRACYAPHMRKPHPVRVFDKNGAAKKDNLALHDIAGPLCFAGDIVVSGVEAPQIEVGDIVVLEEAGGNTHSIRTTHCSRRSPPVYGYEGEEEGLKFTVLSKGSSYEEVLKVWD